MSERFTGSVKWFDSKKGYGFIRLEDNREIFAHYSQIEGSGYRSLQEGQTVEFEITEGNKGPVASNIKVLE